MIDVSNIALRAKGLEPGDVAPEEVEFARNTLRRRDQGIIAAIQVVGLCGDVVDASLLERYLHGAENDLYVEWSIKALCRHLNLIDRYRPLLRQWMRGEGGRFRRMAAIHLGKEYFRDYEDRELGRYLVSVLCDLEDECRGAVRDTFADICQLGAQLSDPFGLDFGDWDEDTTLIVSVAAAKFEIKDLKISLESVTH